MCQFFFFSTPSHRVPTEDSQIFLHSRFIFVARETYSVDTSFLGTALFAYTLLCICMNILG